MTSAQTLLWTVIPRHVADGRWHLSLVVQPRLVAPPAADGSLPRLQQFPELARWPTTLRHWLATGALALEVTASEWSGELGGLRRESALPDLDLWAALFPSDLQVQPAEPDDVSELTVRSFPATELHGALARLYGIVGAICRTELPRLRKLEIAVPGLEYEIQPRRLLDVELPPWNIDGEAGRSDTPAAQAWRFFHPYPDRGPATNPTPAPPPLREDQAPSLDFHARVDALARYPSLARRLGLVLDVSVAAPPVSPSAPQVRLAPPPDDAQGSPTRSHLAPRTACVLVPAEDIFRAADDRSGDVAEGLVRLGESSRFAVQTVHADGAAIALAALATTVESTGDHPADPERAGLPALRTEGITVLRRDRGVDTTNTMKSGAERRASFSDAARPLLSEDLVVGWRIDVREEPSGPWCSLCAQTQDWIVEGATAPTNRRFTLSDEAILEPAATRPYDEQGPKLRELHVHEALFRWDGWSMAAERPGQVIGSKETREVVDGREVSRHVDAHPIVPGRALPPGLRAAMRSWAVAGSLPRLRYGRSYRLRARAVDLAGNSLPPTTSASSDATTTPAVDFLRWEPVAAPVVVLANQPHEGESLERLVIRSAPAEDGRSRTTAANLRFPAGDPSGYRYPAASIRHVAPPKVSQLFAELHGAFDEADGSGLRRGADATRPWAEIQAQAALEGGDFDAHATIVDHPSGKQYIHPGTTLDVPYLPDPLAFACELRVTDLTGGAGLEAQGLHTTRPFLQGPWPNASTFRIRLVDPGDAATTEPDPNALTLAVPPGERVRLRLRSMVREARLGLFGVLPWIESGLATLARNGLPDVLETRSSTLPTAEALRRGVVENGHWMITPTRELELVHAVQRPTRAPVLTGPKPFPARVFRTPDSDAAELSVQLSVHAASTGRVELYATVHDVVDDPAKTGPESTEHTALAFHVDVPERWNDFLLFPSDVSLGLTVAMPSPRHVLGDRRRHRVLYTPVGVTRYRECFDPSLARDPTQLSTSPDAAVALDLVVPASMRPQPPVVREVVPLFRWSAHGSARTPEGRRSVRRTALRVLLERPWCSSGAGERLAVLAVPEGVAPSATRLELVSRWGEDPVQGSANLPPLRAEGVLSDHAVRRVAVPTEGEPVELALRPVDVAFDARRALWIADIDFEQAPDQEPIDDEHAMTAAPKERAIQPIVQLALARYQQDALPGLEASTVVRPDPITLPPWRAIIVRATASGEDVVVRVWLFGRVSIRNHVEAHVIVLASHLPPDDLFWEPAKTAPVMLTRLAGVDPGEPGSELRVEGRAPAYYGELRCARSRIADRAARIRVEEWEPHLHEEVFAESPDGTGDRMPSTEPGRRRVYVDVVDL